MKSNCYKLLPFFCHLSNIFRIFPLIFLIPFAWCSAAYSVQVELAWDEPGGGSPAGYKIHYGTASRQYTESIDAGNCTNWSMAGLEENKTYYFAATAYDSRGAESGFSNEVSKYIPSVSSSGEDVIHLALGFNSNAQGMVYKDDLFYGTSRPTYASGAYVASGGSSGGGLKVALGGLDSKWVANGMSGGWSTSFTVTESGPVSISLRYRLVIAGEYESDEYSRVLVSVDGKLIGASGADHLLELRGADANTPPVDSGWRTATIHPTLTKGMHTLAVGVWNNKKTELLEVTQAYFDEILIFQSINSPDSDNDGFFADDGDCNDSDASIYPGAPEICGDGVDQDCDGQDRLCDGDMDKDGDGFTENQGDPDDSMASVYPGAVEICDDGIDNDWDGLTDCQDGGCSMSCGSGATSQEFGFDKDSEGFAYRDDAFRGTNRGAYATGGYAGSGGYGSGGLQVTLGGVDTKWVADGMSGGLLTSFTVSESGPVSISLKYRLTIAGEYEFDEYSQVLLSMDGNLLGVAGNDHLYELRGTDQITPIQDSGWRTATLQVTLSQGTHTLAVGVWNNKKTELLEVTHAYFDDIMILQNINSPDQDSVIPGDITHDEAFVQEGGSNGLVVMNAENHDMNADVNDHSWVQVVHEGTQAMEAIPDIGTRIASNYLSGSPYLRFNVDFQKTGTHYVWLRGYCSGSDNSAHAGFDGKTVASSENITLPVKQRWVWSGITGSGNRATISVTNVGLHTIEIYMREDGMILDKVLITTSAGYVPANEGPAESSLN